MFIELFRKSSTNSTISSDEDEEEQISNDPPSTSISPPPPTLKKAPGSVHGDKLTKDTDLLPTPPKRKRVIKRDSRPLSVVSAPAVVDTARIHREDLKWYQGGVRKKHRVFVKWIGRIGFVAKGVVYGCIGVLTITNVTGAWTPNGSSGNESPQGAFLLLGGIPSIGRTVLIIMAVGLILYIMWRMWEAFTGQGSDASFSKKKNFFRYRVSPFVSGCVYTAYTYYVVSMIFETSEEQQANASSTTFPASWTKTTIGKAGIGVLGVAFLIAFFTQIINAITGNFIKDLRTSEPNARKWEAFIVHWFGRIGFFGRAALFGTVSGFFWDSLAKDNESGNKNMVAAAINKLATTDGGKFFMVVLGLSLVIYAVFAVSNAYYKYFPTPPPTRFEYYTHHLVHPEYSTSDDSSSSCSSSSSISDDESQFSDQQLSTRTQEDVEIKDNDQPPKTEPPYHRWLQKFRRFLKREKQVEDIEKQ